MTKRQMKKCDKCRRIARFFTTSYKYDADGNVTETIHETVCKVCLYKAVKVRFHNRVDNYKHRRLVNGPFRA